MIQILELTVKVFKAVIIIMLKNVKKNKFTINEKI